MESKEGEIRKEGRKGKKRARSGEDERSEWRAERKKSIWER